ncbi:MAG: hypothetical protein KGJ60_05240 [Verrucomicrobiota bacterium]|nr:hypothetical protein [Verrucomicrobiota bacterium]
MASRLLISLDLLLLTSLAAGAQTAGEFFNHGAQFYISNNIPAARKEVESGRKLFPDDVKLKKLEELLKQQQQNRRQQQRNPASQQRQQSQNSRQDRQQQNQQAQNQSNPKQQQQQKESSRDLGNKNRQASQPTRAEEAKAMTPKEARQLLDAQKDDEQFLQLKPKEPRPNSPAPWKDW